MRRLLLAALLVLLQSSLVFAGEVRREDFAYGIELLTGGESGVFALVIPDDVYLTARREDLGDIRVMNAAGEVLPHAVHMPAEDSSAERPRRRVPFFVLAAKAGAGDREDLTLVVRRGEDGLIAGIAAPVPSREDSRPAYLFDLGKDPSGTASLEFGWRNSSVPLTTVGLFDSEDLVHWRPLVGSAVLADLEYQGNRVVKRDIALPHSPRRYLKILGTGQAVLPVLAEVVAVSAAPATGRERRWVTLDSEGIGREEGALVARYKGEYRLRADRARLGFAESNSMVRAAVQSRPDSRSPWSTRCAGVYYSLRVEGTAIASDSCTFPPTADSWWRLQIFADGAGVESSGHAPTLELGWRAAELLFVARGPGPYMLLYGSGKAARSAGAEDPQMLLEAVAKSGNPPVRSAKAGSRIEVGGAQALQPPPRPLPWRRWLLWAVLAAGIALLAAMVRHLWLDIGRPQ